jgi:hypothetical protein
MLISLWDLMDFIRVFEIWDLWKAARAAPEGTRLHRWRYVVQGIVLLILLPLVLGLPVWITILLLKA